LTDDGNNNGGRPKCPQCRADIDVNNVTDFTSFLRVHCPEHESLQGLDLQGESESVSDSDSDSDDESDDGDERDDLGGFIVYDTDPDDESGSRKPAQRRKKSKRRSEKSRARPKQPPKSLGQLRKEGMRNKSARRRYLRRLKKTFEPSAKTIRTLELLEEIKDRGGGEKTIVFSNFTSFLDIIETTLYDHRTLSNYVRYDGSMTSNERNDAVLEFTENPNCGVMLVSLRSGNAGLNLTAANHVIMLDPFWNPFVEYQAADRCHRIGQQRPVTIHRVLIGQDDPQDGDRVTGDGAPKDPSVGYTVEDRILNLQEKKRRLVETALDETAGRQVSRLGVRELGYLFGLNSL
jgi:SNF2 family DNA or RNA helicase